MENKHFRLFNKKTLQLITKEYGFFCAVLQKKIKVDIRFFYVILREHNENILTNKVAVPHYI